MATNAHDKEKVAPLPYLPSPPSSSEDNADIDELEQPYVYIELVEIALTSHHDLIVTPASKSSSATILAAEKRKRGGVSDEDEAAEKMKRDLLPDDDDDGGDEDGWRSLESSTEFGDVEMEELLEIERSIPDNHEDDDIFILDLHEPPQRPGTPFENQSSRIQAPPSEYQTLNSQNSYTPLENESSSFETPPMEFQPYRSRRPYCESRTPRPQTPSPEDRQLNSSNPNAESRTPLQSPPPEDEAESLRSQQVEALFLLCRDLSALPAPLSINKSSYFSQHEPMQTDSEFENVDNEDDDYDWFEDGEIKTGDGIRREEIELSWAEWKLIRDPLLGKYRVTDISCLRICETIESYA